MGHGLCQFPHSLWPPCMIRAGYFLGEVNCCLRVMPFPSSMVTIWPAATPVKFSLLPSGQRTDISAAVALPSPKCTRKSLCEMKEPPLRTSSICL